MYRFIVSNLRIVLASIILFIQLRKTCIVAFSIPVLNITEVDVTQTGNGPLPKWADSPVREEFFNSVHNVPVNEQQLLSLRNKWLEQG